MSGFARNADRITLLGNTFAVKDELKKLGGRYDSNTKTWNVPKDHARTAQDLVCKAQKYTERGAL